MHTHSYGQERSTRAVSSSIVLALFDLQPGETWQFTPKTAGRYPCVCTLHPGMAGTLIVSTRQQSR
jgi:plastocyanin